MITKETHKSTVILSIQTNEFNSFDREFFLELSKEIEEAEKNPKCKTIILTGKNDKYFSNGFNPALFIGKSYEEIHSHVALSVKSCGNILFSKKPVLSALNGFAMGVGAVIAIFSDYRVMVNKNARFGFPEGLIGLNFPSTTATVLIELVGIQKARELLYGSKAVKPDEALKIGLVDELCEPESLLQTSLKWCAKFEFMAMESVTGLKLALRDSLRSTAQQLEPRDIELLSNAIFSPNGQEGLRSILEKRRPVWQDISV